MANARMLRLKDQGFVPTREGRSPTVRSEGPGDWCRCWSWRVRDGERESFEVVVGGVCSSEANKTMASQPVGIFNLRRSSIRTVD
jgi:hypothetical protein